MKSVAGPTVDHHEFDDYANIHFLRGAKITVRFNRSDETCGWNGVRDSFKVFYLHHPLEYSYTKSDDQSHTLTHGQIPIVSFSLRTKRYLGKPYTDCNPTTNYTKRLSCYFFMDIADNDI